MNDNSTTVNKLLEEDEECFKFIDEESLCTSCKLEMDNLNPSNATIKQENSIHFEDNIYSQSLDNFDNCYELQKATRSLSKISLEQNDLELITNINNNDNQDHQINHQIVNNNIINNNDDAVIVHNLSFNYSPSFICTGIDKALEILEQDQSNSIVKKTKTDTLPKIIQSNNAAVIDGKNKSLCDKETQTDLAKEQNEVDNSWVDNVFLSEEELEKIDHLMNEYTNGEIDRNNKRKHDNAGIVENNNKKIKIEAKEWNYTDCDSMVADILKRQKKCLDCSNDLYQYSEYLDETKKALIRKSPSTNIEIPTPPVLVGYDNYFDFKNEKRFVKLPIQKIRSDSTHTNNNNNNNKLNGINGTHNSMNIKPKIYQQKTSVTSKQGPIQKNRLSLPRIINPNRINNQVNSTSRRTLRQSTIKEAFAVNKENHNKPLNHIKSINNTIDNAKVNTNCNNGKNLEKALNLEADKDNFSDSLSMYQFNPLRRKNNTQK